MTLRGVVVWFAKAWNFMEGAASGALKIIGFVVVLVIGSCYMTKEKPGAEKADQAAAVGRGAGAGAGVGGDGVASCLCSAGSSCAGPRGGVYCLTDAGAKRYLPRP